MRTRLVLPIVLLGSCSFAPGAIALPQQVHHDVPFVVQAPLGNWSDLRKAEGCEEASVIMALHWAKGDMKFTPAEADAEINRIVEFEKTAFGAFEDTSVTDTARIFTEYYEYPNVQVLYDIGPEDFKRELADGKIALVPVDATKLPTPNYDGPLRHMIVIHGYDEARRVFFSNDPGTASGEDLTYSFDAIEQALRNYPTGEDEKIKTPRAVMLVVWK